MRALSAEVHLAIIQYLDVLDVVRLEQTSCEFRALVREDAGVWKGLLRRQCHFNGLFWPTFSNLKTATEFRDAVASPFKFSRSYRLAFQTEEPLDGRLLSSRDIQKPRGVLHHRGLIPGGRYLLNIAGGELHMWDIFRDTIVAKKSLLHSQKSMLKRHSLVTIDKVWVLIQTPADLPEHFTNPSDGILYAATRVELIEIRQNTDDGKFVVQELGHLVFIHTIQDAPVLVKDVIYVKDSGKVMFRLCSHDDRERGLLWDFRSHAYVEWRSDNDEVRRGERWLVQGGCVVQVDYWNVHTLELPAVARLIENDYVLLSPATSLLCLSPAKLHIPSPKVTDQLQGGYFCWLGLFTEAGSRHACPPGMPLYYTTLERVRIHEGCGEVQADTFKLRLHRILIDPSQPVKIAVECISVETYEHRFSSGSDIYIDCYESDEGPVYTMCNGVVVQVWSVCEGKYGITFPFVTISDLVPPSQGFDRTSVNNRHVRDEEVAVPAFGQLGLVPIGVDTRGISVVSLSPGTGNAFVFRYKYEPGFRLECAGIDIYDVTQ